MMKTEKTNGGIEYKVLDAQGKVIWSKFVKFLPGRPSGGPEFRDAAREQERVALKHAGTA